VKTIQFKFLEKGDGEDFSVKKALDVSGAIDIKTLIVKVTTAYYQFMMQLGLELENINHCVQEYVHAVDENMAEVNDSEVAEHKEPKKVEKSSLDKSKEATLNSEEAFNSFVVDFNNDEEFRRSVFETYIESLFE